MIFDEQYDVVDCNTCTEYWDSKCDGTTYAQKCKSYMATRKVKIPQEIEKLDHRIKDLALRLIIGESIIYFVVIILAIIIWRKL